MTEHDQSGSEVIDLIRNKEHRTLYSTIGLIFKSRRGVTSFATSAVVLLVTVLVHFFPQFSLMEENLIYLVAAGVTYILGLSWEDANRAAAEASRKEYGSIEEQVRAITYETIESALDAAFEDEEDVKPDTPAIG